MIFEDQLSQEPPVDPESIPDLGPCCVCGSTELVRNVMMLHKSSPLIKRGWGCLVCGLTESGACAVLCDNCLGSPLKFVCDSLGGESGRIPIEDFDSTAVPFNHDEAKHAE